MTAMELEIISIEDLYRQLVVLFALERPEVAEAVEGSASPDR